MTLQRLEISNDRKKMALEIMAYVMLSCIIMYVVEKYFAVGYLNKSIIKIMLFLIGPIIYCWKKPTVNIKSFFVVSRKKQLVIPLIMGIAVYILLLSGYVLLSPWIDLNQISSQLANNMQVTAQNFIWVAGYISLGNSLLEEFFFRGFIFLGLLTLLPRWQAYCFSSGLFALYHIAILDGWFTWPLLVLAVMGLLIAGYFFNWLDERNGHIYNSWLVHIGANIAINTIGLIMFKNL